MPKGAGTWIWRRFGRTNETHCESINGFTNASSFDLVPTRAVGENFFFLKSNLLIIMIPLLCMVKELYWHRLGVSEF